MPSLNTQSVDFPGRDRLLRWVVSGFSTVARFQQFCGVKDNSGASNPIHAIFVAGAALGNELFFITFLPALFWFVDFNVGRRVVTAWAFAYWVGQVLKDSLKLPRPDKEVVIQLEHHYAAEYGMPSTHAMNAILMPFYILYLLDDRIQHGHVTLLAIAMLWLVLCTLSRLYMGVHSVPDILVGLGIGLICLALGVGYGAVIDDLIFTSTWSWAAIPVVCCLAVALYPRPSHWVNSPGDTAIIIGVALGVLLGAMAAPELHRHTPPIHLHIAQGTTLLVKVVETVVALGALAAIRAVMKPLSMALLSAITGQAVTDPRRPPYAVELPSKLVTYGSIGVATVCLLPLAFEAMGGTRFSQL